MRLVSLAIILAKGQLILIDWELFSLERGSLVYRILFDRIRLRFLAVVFLISGRVMFYRHEYIAHEESKNSFAFIVFLFVMSIIFLIIRPSLIRVILGWDGLGLVSFLLVIYYQNYKSYRAGMITCLSNRIGDRAILISIGWFLITGSLDFIYYLRERREEMKIARGFIILAAITKRAQIPFSAWLPAAIAAPTPVSALVHSSTLVTAGVYLLIRFFPAFSLSEMKNLLFIIGSLTIIISRLGALYETDLKKVIALSTLRQLGLMMMSLRIGFYILSFFHLLTHALFKACLFLCAGRMIHLYEGSQDVRNLRVVTRYIPTTSSCLVVCSLALGGRPFLAAFYSKDKIIEEAFRGGYNVFCLVMLFISVLLTIIYRFRLVKFITMERGAMIYNENKDRMLMIKPIIVLTLGGIIGGRVLRWIFLDLRYDNLILSFKRSILLLFILGGVAGVNIMIERGFLKREYIGRMWFLPRFSGKFILFWGLRLGGWVYKYWDAGWNEKVGPLGLREELRTLRREREKSYHLSFKFYLIISLLIIILLYFCFYFYSLYKAWHWSC